MKFLLTIITNAFHIHLKFLGLGIMLLLAGSICHGQDSVYFSKRLDLSGDTTFDTPLSFLIDNDRYIIAGQVFDYGIGKWFHFISEIDINGNIMSSKYWGDTINHNYLGRPDCFIKFSQSSYYSVGTRQTPTDNWVFNRGLLTKYDNNLDTIWTKEYHETTLPVDTSIIFKHLLSDASSHLLISGRKKKFEEGGKAFIIKVDSLGNEIWHYNYGTGGLFDYIAYDAVTTPDSGYAIGGFKYEIAADPIGEAFLLKLDKNGAFVWEKGVNWSYTNQQASICTSPSGNIILGTQINLTQDPDQSYGRINIIEYNNEGDEIWNKHVGPYRWNSVILDIVTKENGNIIACGKAIEEDNFPAEIGWILKLNSSGDSIWYREYKLLEGDYSQNLLRSIKIDESNSIIAIGELDPYPPDTGSTDTWLLKLDSNGCLIPGCDPTVHIYETSAQGVAIELFPNPTHNYINVRNLNKRLVYRAFVYNNYGILEKEIVISNREEIKINIAEFPPGMKIFKLISNQNTSSLVFIKI